MVVVIDEAFLPTVDEVIEMERYLSGEDVYYIREPREEDADELAVARWISGCGAFLESDE